MLSTMSSRPAARRHIFIPRLFGIRCMWSFAVFGSAKPQSRAPVSPQKHLFCAVQQHNDLRRAAAPRFHNRESTRLLVTALCQSEVKRCAAGLENVLPVSFLYSSSTTVCENNPEQKIHHRRPKVTKVTWPRNRP